VLTISDAVSVLGGTLNAYTDFDSTCYYLLLPSEYMELGLRILMQIACQARFLLKDIKIEKDIILEEIRQYQNDPEIDFIEFIQYNSFDHNPMKYPVLGFAETLNGITSSGLSDFYNRYYNPNNAFLVLTGDLVMDEIDKEQYIRNLCMLSFGNWQNNNERVNFDPNLFLEPEVMGRKLIPRMKKNSFPMIAVTLPELTERHSSSNIMLFAMRAFAIGKSSRLYKTLVEDKKLCSGIRVSSLCGILSGVSVILITPNSVNNLAAITSEIQSEYNNLISEGLNKAEFELIKKDIIYGWLSSFESMENHASTLAMEELYRGYEHIYFYDIEIGDLEYQYVNEGIRAYWTPDSIRIFLQTPIQAPMITLDIVQDTNQKKFKNSNILVQNDSPILTSTNSEKKTHDILYNSPHEDFYTSVLSNGIAITFKHIQDKPFSAVSLSSGLSQLMESDNNRGLNYLCSTAMLYGSKKYDYDAVQRISRYNGINIRVLHHIDSLTFRGKCLNDNLETMLMILSDLFFNPTFPHKHVALIKRVTLENLRREKDFPASVAYKNWFRMLVGNRTNLDSNTGKISQFARIKYNDIVSWYYDMVLEQDFHIGVVGNHSPELVFKLCEQYLGWCPKNSKKPQRSQFIHYNPSQIKEKYQKYPSEQAIINIGGFCCPATQHLENTAMHILAHILGGDLSSRLYTEVREKYGYAYQTGFDVHTITQTGFWNAYAYCDPDNYKPALSLMKDVIKDVCENGISLGELHAAQNYLVASQRFDAESVSWQANTISILQALGYDLQYFLSREARVRTVSVSDVNKVANKYLRSEDLFIHIMR